MIRNLTLSHGERGSNRLTPSLRRGCCEIDYRRRRWLRVKRLKGLASFAIHFPGAGALGYRISPRLGLLLLLLACALTAGFAHAADPPRKVDDQTIRRKLQAARADLKVDKVPLAEVVAQFEKKHGIPMRLDEAALKKAGVAVDTPITASFKNFTLNAALHHLLKDLGLHHLVANGEILITAGAEPAGEDLEAVGKARVERKTVEERQKEAAANVAAAEKARLAQMQARAVQMQAAAAMVDPAQLAADLDALEKQFTRRFRAALRTELSFVQAVCDPTAEQIDQIRESLEKYRADVVKTKSDFQKRIARKGLNGQEAIGFPDARQVLRANLPRTVKAHLTIEQIERFQSELDRRERDRTRAAVHTLVARLDRDLTLSAEQREKISESLTSHWNAAWAQQFEIFLQQGDQFVPNFTEKMVGPYLNPIQKKIWRGSQASGANSQIILRGGFMGPGGGGLAGLMGVMEEDLDDDDDDAEEPLLPAGTKEREQSK